MDWVMQRIVVLHNSDFHEVKNASDFIIIRRNEI